MNWKPPLLLLASGVAACGCNRQPFHTVPVSGVVTLDGRPLDGARVSFQPSDSAAAVAPGSLGTTGADGRYSLTLIGASGDGALPGTHRVQINRPTPSPSAGDDASIPDMVPARYNRATKLTFVVPPTGTDAADFQLTTK